MAISKLYIKSDPQGLYIFRSSELGENYQSIIATREELIEALLEMPNSDELLAKLQERKLEKERKQYEKLKPAGFDDHAPKSTQEKRKELEGAGNVKKMEWLKSIVSYNADHTINILPIHKTFCEDISGQNKSFNFAQAQELEKTNAGGYKLMTDYNGTDTQQEKEQSDWYRLINIFSNGNGDTVEGIKLFRDMAGCNNRYWTATPYKNEQGKIVSGAIQLRELNKNACRRCGDDTYCHSRVCGFRDSI